jgi:hypothetical protein
MLCFHFLIDANRVPISAMLIHRKLAPSTTRDFFSLGKNHGASIGTVAN